MTQAYNPAITVFLSTQRDIEILDANFRMPPLYRYDYNVEHSVAVSNCFSERVLLRSLVFNGVFGHDLPPFCRYHYDAGTYVLEGI